MTAQRTARAPSSRALVAWCRARGDPDGLLEQGGPAELRPVPRDRAALRPGLHRRRRAHPGLPARPRPRPDRPAAVRRAAPDPQSGTPLARRPRSSPSPGPGSPRSTRSGASRWTTCSDRPSSAGCTSGHGCTTDDKRYRFPRSYRKYVVGSLPYERMLGGVHLLQGLPQRQLGDRQQDDVLAPAVRALRRADRGGLRARGQHRAVLRRHYRGGRERRGDRASPRRTPEQRRVPRPPRAPGAPPGLRRAPLLPPRRRRAAQRRAWLDAPRPTTRCQRRSSPTKRPEQLDHVLATIGKQIAPRDRAGAGHPRLRAGATSQRARSTGSTSSWSRPPPTSPSAPA